MSKIKNQFSKLLFINEWQFFFYGSRRQELEVDHLRELIKILEALNLDSDGRILKVFSLIGYNLRYLDAMGHLFALQHVEQAIKSINIINSNESTESLLLINKKISNKLGHELECLPIFNLDDDLHVMMGILKERIHLIWYSIDEKKVVSSVDFLEHYLEVIIAKIQSLVIGNEVKINVPKNMKIWFEELYVFCRKSNKQSPLSNLWRQYLTQKYKYNEKISFDGNDEMLKFVEYIRRSKSNNNDLK